MSYCAEISRSRPTAIVFVVDQTGSMAAPLGGSAVSKARALADAVNRTLQTLAIRCMKNEEIRDYFSCALIGFGRRESPIVSGWEGPLAGAGLLPISTIYDNPLRVEHRSRAVANDATTEDGLFNFPVWLPPRSELGVPAAGHECLIERSCECARGLLEEWVRHHRDCYPPTVLLVTDGGEEGGDPLSAAERLKTLKTNDGCALLYCCHLSTTTTCPVVFPDSERGLPDDYSRLLFRMASVLPAAIARGLHEEWLAASKEAKGYVLNADAVKLVEFLDVGTRVSHTSDASAGR